MSNDQLKAITAARLRGFGIEVSDDAAFTVLSDAISKLGGKRPYNAGREDHVRAWMAPQRPESFKYAFRPKKPERPHLGQAEIDALPRPISMSGAGIGGNSGMGRGR